MSVEVHWDRVMGPARAAARITGLERKLRRGGLRQPLQEIVREVLAPSMRRQFETNGVSGDGNAWSPLKETTQRRWNKRASPALVQSGKLKRAAGAIARWNVNNNEVRFAGLPLSVVYGYLHQTGTVNMTDRPWIRFSDGDDVKAKEILSKWVGNQVRTMK